MPKSLNLPPVLLVEDSPDDIDFARRAFAKCAVGDTAREVAREITDQAPQPSVPRELVIAEDGDQALDLLTGADGSRPLWPAIVLLDLNIPGLDGRQLLARMKSDPHLRAIPVVVLTTSTRRGDIDACYNLGANSYHQKSPSYRQYEATIGRIAQYWLHESLTPGRDPLAETFAPARRLTTNLPRA